jgi:hypothetical protein
MAEQSKRKVRVKSKRPGKDAIIAFRLETAFSEKLGAQVDSVLVNGIKSQGDMARKIVMDFLMGRLVYPIPEYRTLNPARTSHQTPALS